MPDHIHLVVMRFDETIEWVAGYLKRAANRELSRQGIHPQAGLIDRHGRVPTFGVDGGWCGYLITDGDIEHSIKYVRGNPRKAVLPDQDWQFAV